MSQRRLRAARAGTRAESRRQGLPPPTAVAIRGAPCRPRSPRFLPRDPRVRTRPGCRRRVAPARLRDGCVRRCASTACGGGSSRGSAASTGRSGGSAASPPVVALIIFLLVGRNRRGAIENQTRARAGEGRRSAVAGAYRMFVCFARCMTETMEYYGPRAKPCPHRRTGAEPRGRALERGRGVILATAHVGNWDISGRALARDRATPCTW